MDTSDDHKLLQYDTYDDYLNALVTKDDIRFMRSTEYGRQIAALGYRLYKICRTTRKFIQLPYTGPQRKLCHKYNSQYVKKPSVTPCIRPENYTHLLVMAVPHPTDFCKSWHSGNAPIVCLFYR